MNLFDICLESVMFDYYCTEGFKDTLKNAGKAVIKGVARVIDFLINVARQTLNLFRNILRKMTGKNVIKIENKSILTNLVTSAKMVKTIKHDMAKEYVKMNNINNTTSTILKSSYDDEYKIYDTIRKIDKTIDNSFNRIDRVADDGDDNFKEIRQSIQRASNSIKVGNKKGLDGIDSDELKNMREISEKIINDYHNDLIDIDTMNKQLPEYFKLSDELINRIKKTTKVINDGNKELDKCEKILDNDIKKDSKMIGKKIKWHGEGLDVDDKKVSKQFDEFMKNKDRGSLKFE